VNCAEVRECGMNGGCVIAQTRRLRAAIGGARLYNMSQNRTPCSVREDIR
jgi:hypothetical protein